LFKAKNRGKLRKVGKEGDMKAVFLDRDGVINELVYHEEQGIIDSPFTPEQFKLLPGVDEAIRNFQEMDYKVILASNQPGIAKGHLSWEAFDKVRQRMIDMLAVKGVALDGEYYCLHHPESKIENLKARCTCRKPKPGLLLQAAKENGIDLAQSWMIGDGLTDIIAGELAGTRTALIGKVKCELCKLMDENNVKPDMICTNLLEASRMAKSRVYVSYNLGLFDAKTFDEYISLPGM
jgi:D-glycero-D-manno-heptose 1,7-bisphosphate phosphatase